MKKALVAIVIAGLTVGSMGVVNAKEVRWDCAMSGTYFKKGTVYRFTFNKPRNVIVTVVRTGSTKVFPITRNKDGDIELYNKQKLGSKTWTEVSYTINEPNKTVMYQNIFSAYGTTDVSKSPGKCHEI